MPELLVRMFVQMVDEFRGVKWIGSGLNKLTGFLLVEPQPIYKTGDTDTPQPALEWPV